MQEQALDQLTHYQGARRKLRYKNLQSEHWEEIQTGEKLYVTCTVWNSLQSTKRAISFPSCYPQKNLRLIWLQFLNKHIMQVYFFFFCKVTASFTVVGKLWSQTT